MDATDSIRVLLLVDQLSNCQDIQQILESKLACKCICENTPAAYTAALQEQQPDVSIIDLSHAADNILPLIKTAQETTHNAPILLVGNSLDEKLLVQTIQAGASDFVTRKNIERLPDAIQEALARRSASHPSSLAPVELTRLEKLLQSEQMYRLITENMAETVSLLDLNLKFTYVSPSIERLRGYTAEESMAQTLNDVLTPQSLALCRQKLQEEMALEASGTADPQRILKLELEEYCKDGSIIWIDNHLKFLRDADGKPTAILVVSEDISERKRAQLTLQESEEKFRQMVERSNDIFYRQNISTYQFEYVSPKVFDTLGYTQEEFKEWAAKDLITKFHPDDQPMARSFINELIETDVNGKSHLERQFRFLNKQGEFRWIHGNYSLVRDKDNRPQLIVGSLSDITELKLAREALEKRILALTQPLDDTANITFEDLFNLEDIQRLQDEFAAAAGVASLITRPDGTPITAQSNFCRLCGDVIRRSEKGRINCANSDAELGRYLIDGPTLQPCKSAGLWGAGAGITVGGKHIANWLIGQVRDDTQTDEKLRRYAHEIDVDEQELLEAFHEVPIMSQEQFQKVSQALFTLANQLSTSAYQNVLQARFITAQKQSEERLRESEEKYRLIAENATDVIWVMDANDNRFLFVSPSIERLRGYTVDEVMQQRLEEMMTPASYAYAQRVMAERVEKFLQGEIATYVDEIEQPRKDGSTVWTETTTRYSINKTSGHLEIFGASRDISERKRAEAALRESEERYYLIDEASPDAIYSFDAHGRFTHVNSSVCRQYDRPREQIIGKTLAELGFPQKMVEEWDGLRLQVYKTNATVTAEKSIPYKDGSRQYFEVVLNPIHDENGAIIGIAGTTRNIEARKQAEAKIQEQLEELRRWHAITLNREDRILELKREVNQLLTESGKPPRYNSALETEHA